MSISMSLNVGVALDTPLLVLCLLHCEKDVSYLSHHVCCKMCFSCINDKCMVRHNDCILCSGDTTCTIFQLYLNLFKFSINKTVFASYNKTTLLWISYNKEMPYINHYDATV